MIRHPLERLGARAMAALVIAPVTTFAVLRYLDTRITTDAVSSNLQLQMAGSHARVIEIVDSWRSAGVMHLVWFAEGFDFLHLVLYPTAIAAGCAIVARRSRSVGATSAAAIGVILAWVGWLAAPLDATETIMTLPMLSDPGTGSPATVRAVSLLKFACTGVAASYAIGGALITSRALRRAG